MSASIFVNISDFVISISVSHYSGKPGESGIVKELFWALGNGKNGPMNLSLSCRPCVFSSVLLSFLLSGNFFGSSLLVFFSETQLEVVTKGLLRLLRATFGWSNAGG